MKIFEKGVPQLYFPYKFSIGAMG